MKLRQAWCCCVVYQLVTGLNCWENNSVLTGQLQGIYKKTHVTVQDNIETTHIATGAPVGACVVLLTNGDIL